MSPHRRGILAATRAAVPHGRGLLSAHPSRSIGHLSPISATPAPAPPANTPRPRVLLGLSGGVDSAVAAVLLQERGFDLQLVHMRNWDASDENNHCTGEQDLWDARRVAEHLGLPLSEVSFSKEYWSEVFEPMLDEYTRARTPNPDIGCNRFIKFGYFLKYAFETARADYLATGHYARLLYPVTQQGQQGAAAPLMMTSDGSYAFLPGTAQVTFDPYRSALGPHTNNESGSNGDSTGDGVNSIKSSVSFAQLSRSQHHVPAHHSFGHDYAVGGVHARAPPPPSARLVSGVGHKDQTYFLSSVLAGHLDRVIFPLGHLPKEQVRAIAAAAGLPVAAKTDSRGICFVGKKRSFVDFIDGYLPPKDRRSGPIVSPDGLASALALYAAEFAPHTRSSSSGSVSSSESALARRRRIEGNNVTVNSHTNSDSEGDYDEIFNANSNMNSYSYHRLDDKLHYNTNNKNAKNNTNSSGSFSTGSDGFGSQSAPDALPDAAADAAALASLPSELRPLVSFAAPPSAPAVRMTLTQGLEALFTPLVDALPPTASFPLAESQSQPPSQIRAMPSGSLLAPPMAPAAPQQLAPAGGSIFLPSSPAASNTAASPFGSGFSAGTSAEEAPIWQRAAAAYGALERLSPDEPAVALADALFLKGRRRLPAATTSASASSSNAVSSASSSAHGGSAGLAPARDFPLEHSGLVHYTEGKRVADGAFPLPYRCVRKLRAINAVCAAPATHAVTRRTSFLVRGFSWQTPFPPLMPSHDFASLQRSLAPLARWHRAEQALLLGRVHRARAVYLERWHAIARGHARSAGEDPARAAHLRELEMTLETLIPPAVAEAERAEAEAAAAVTASTSPAAETVTSSGDAGVDRSLACTVATTLSLQRAEAQGLLRRLPTWQHKEFLSEQRAAYDAARAREPFNASVALAPLWAYAATTVQIFPLSDRAPAAAATQTGPAALSALGVPCLAKLRSTGALVPVRVSAERVPRALLEECYDGRGAGVARDATLAQALEAAGLQGHFRVEAAEDAESENVADAGAAANSAAVDAASASAVEAESRARMGVAPAVTLGEDGLPIRAPSSTIDSDLNTSSNSDATSSTTAAASASAGDENKGKYELCLRVHLPAGFSEALTPGQTLALYRALPADLAPDAEDAARALWPPVEPKFERFLGSTQEQVHRAEDGGVGARFNGRDLYECMGAGLIAL